MSRIIVHKTELDSEGYSGSMSDAIVAKPHLQEQTEVIHSREGEELSLACNVLAEIDDLEEGKALVIYKVII